MLIKCCASKATPPFNLVLKCIHNIKCYALKCFHNNITRGTWRRSAVEPSVVQVVNVLIIRLRIFPLGNCFLMPFFLYLINVVRFFIVPRPDGVDSYQRCPTHVWAHNSAHNSAHNLNKQLLNLRACPPRASPCVTDPRAFGTRAAN